MTSEKDEKGSQKKKAKGSGKAATSGTPAPAQAGKASGAKQNHAASSMKKASEESSGQPGENPKKAAAPRSRRRGQAKTVHSSMTPIGTIDVRYTPNPLTGAIGTMKMVPIEKLKVDISYQRPISMKSIRVIRRICEGFDWHKFLPVITVAQDDEFAIIDGRHRVTAANTLGITHVPCYVLNCSHAEAAGAFAAINGCVTPVAPYDVWFAQITAKEPETLRLKEILDREGVKIVRSDPTLIGETSAISVLRRARHFYGDILFPIILRCIVHTGDGNPGMLFGSVINGIGRSIMTKQGIVENQNKLYKIFSDVKLRDLVIEARIESASTGNPMQFIVTRQVNALLRGTFD